jgi:hypothetical protein
MQIQPLGMEDLLNFDLLARIRSRYDPARLISDGVSLLNEIWFANAVRFVFSPKSVFLKNSSSNRLALRQFTIDSDAQIRKERQR